MAQYCFARTLYSMHFMALYLQAIFLPTSDFLLILHMRTIQAKPKLCQILFTFCCMGLERLTSTL